MHVQNAITSGWGSLGAKPGKAPFIHLQGDGGGVNNILAFYQKKIHISFFSYTSGGQVNVRKDTCPDKIFACLLQIAE